MRKRMEIYDSRESRSVRGEFRSMRELDTGAWLGYFESAEYADVQAIVVLYADGTYFVVEQLKEWALTGSGAASLPGRGT